MSVFRKIRTWLAHRLRPGEPRPDRRDLNLPDEACPPVDRPGISLHDISLAERERHIRELHARYRSRCGPWQQK